MSAKQAQHDAAEALLRAIIEALDKHREDHTLTEVVLAELGRAYASVSSNVPEQGRLGQMGVDGRRRQVYREVPREGAAASHMRRAQCKERLAAALEAEIAACVGQFEADEHGHRLVVLDRYHAQREVLTAAGALSV